MSLFLNNRILCLNNTWKADYPKIAYPKIALSACSKIYGVPIIRTQIEQSYNLHASNEI